MNTNRFLWVIVATSLVAVFASCSKSDSEDPAPSTPSISVTINGVDSLSQLTLDIDDTLTISGEMSVPLGIANYESSYEIDGSTVVIERFTPDGTIFTSYVMKNYEEIMDFTYAGQEVTFSFVVTDTTGATAEHTFILNINDSPIDSRTDIIASPYNQYLKGNLYNTVEDTLYFPINVKTNEDNQIGVDLIFAYDDDAGYLLSSPSDANADTIWNYNVNFDWPFLDTSVTSLMELSSQVNFDRVATAKQIADLYSGTSSSVLSGLYVGEIIAFQLDESKDGKLGLMRITSIVGSKSTERQITFDLKLEQ